MDAYNLEGHHPTYFRIYAKLLSGLGMEVFGLVRDNQDIAIAKSIAGNNLSAIRSYRTTLFLRLLILTNRFVENKILSSLIYWLSIKASINQFDTIEPAIFIIWYDPRDGMIPGYLKRFVPKNLVLLDGKSLGPESKGIGEIAHLRAGGNTVYNFPHVRKVFFLDEEAYDFFLKKEPQITQKLRWIPDVVDPNMRVKKGELFDEVNNQVKERKVVLYLGGISQKKKNILGFIRLAELANNDKMCFVVVGRLHPSHFTKEQLKVFEQKKSSLSNLLVIEKRAKDHELIPLIRLASLVYLVYNDHPFSSNFLTLAAFNETPVIVADHSLMQRRVKRYQIGYSFSEIENDITLLSEGVIPKHHFNRFEEDYAIDKIARVLEETFCLS